MHLLSEALPWRVKRSSWWHCVYQWRHLAPHTWAWPTVTKQWQNLHCRDKAFWNWGEKGQPTFKKRLHRKIHFIRLQTVLPMCFVRLSCNLTLRWWAAPQRHKGPLTALVRLLKNPHDCSRNQTNLWLSNSLSLFCRVCQPTTLQRCSVSIPMQTLPTKVNLLRTYWTPSSVFSLKTAHQAEGKPEKPWCPGWLTTC